MTTYNDLATRKDREFHRKVRRELGFDRYMELVPLAKAAFEEGLKEPNEIKRFNKALRMANQVFSNEIAKVNNVRKKQSEKINAL